MTRRQRQYRAQALHFAVAAASVVPREHAQHGRKLFMEGDSALDGLFYLIGGTLAGWLL